MNKCVFLDRDGVINEDRGTYTFRIEDFKIITGVKQGLTMLKDAGYILVVVTNQAGISRGLYTEEELHQCHIRMMEETNHLIDEIYYASYYPEYSSSLMRKPDSLMFEKAIAKYNIDPSMSWMIGNSDRDLKPAIKLGIKTVFIGDILPETEFDFSAGNLLEAAEKIIAHQSNS
jgi:D-glycero-D-manno-heptose 1,7-bisphosphate phosphatase